MDFRNGDFGGFLIDFLMMFGRFLIDFQWIFGRYSDDFAVLFGRFLVGVSIVTKKNTRYFVHF